MRPPVSGGDWRPDVFPGTLDPSADDPSGGHARSAAQNQAAAFRVRLIIGALDAADVCELRDVLGSLAARGRVWLTVDLAGLDDQHHLTATAVLSVAAGKMQDQGSILTVCNPPRSLAAVLAAIPILVTGEQPGAAGTGGIQVIQVGKLATDPRPAARRTSAGAPAPADDCLRKG